MSFKSILEKKSNYLVSIGFLGFTFIVNGKLEFTSITIRDDEIKKISELSYPYIFTIDNVKYVGEYFLNAKFNTIKALIGDTDTGVLVKAMYTNNKNVKLLAIFSDLISIQDANDQLNSLLEQLYDKNYI